jgi:DNA-binding winged helix-turn-helix (wHTH) protein/TolB-like protein
MTRRESYAFGPFRLDPPERVLLRESDPVPLPPKAYDLLVTLVAHAGHLVTKEELLSEVWPGTFVEEANLSYTVSLLRKALGDDREPYRYIETVPKRGYRFKEPLRSAEALLKPLADAASAPKSRRRRIIAMGVVLLGCVAMAAVKSLWWTQSPIRSLAVLPLKLNGDTQHEYLAEGLTEALGTALGQVGSLELKSGTSARRYKNTDKSAPVIAHELGVDALIEGSVTPQLKRVLIVVNLIDGRTDRRIWTATYDRDLGDVLSLLAEVTRAIASEVRATVEPQEDARLTARQQSVSSEAYDAYLRGLYFRGRWQVGGCPRAAPYFERAIGADPAFADAYTHLAWCYTFPDRTRQPVDIVGPKAKEAVAAALKLDANNSTAHAVLGTIKHRLDYDWAAAEREFELAVTLNPKDPDALIGLGEYLYSAGRIERGIESVRQSLAQDPFALDNNVALAYALRSAGQYDEAIRRCEDALELDNNWSTARLWLADTYGVIGSHDQAVAHHLTWLRQILVPARMVALTEELADSYKRFGWRAFWQKELELAQEETRHPGTIWAGPYGRYCGPYYMARRYARLGDRARAIALLQRAYRERHHLMVFLKLEPLFNSLRGDPAFTDLVRRVGIP